jgi:hypothetical protein
MVCWIKPISWTLSWTLGIFMAPSEEVQRTLDRLVYKKRHTMECQARNKLTEWQQLSDSRKRCSCPYWSCGIHDGGEGFTRKSTGELSLERAKAVVRFRLETGNRTARLEEGTGTPITEAIADFMAYTRDGGARESTLLKYKTLMEQLQAFVDWNPLPGIDATL